MVNFDFSVVDVVANFIDDEWTWRLDDVCETTIFGSCTNKEINVFGWLG